MLSWNPGELSLQVQSGLIQGADMTPALNPDRPTLGSIRENSL